jgi:alkylation response protein AidB-like acyl-CoA dehydrogenase
MRHGPEAIMAHENGNFFRDNEDLLFQFAHGLEWPELVELVEAGYTLPDGPKNLEEAKAFYEGAADAVGEFAAREIAPRERAIDRKGTHLDPATGEVVFSDELNAIYAGMKDLGLFGLCVPRELGGMNAPLAMYFVANELIARADVSVMTHFGFFGGVAQSLLLYALREGSAKLEGGRVVSTRWEDAIRTIAAGEAHGCMVLTEPGAGSDLASLRTRAVERDGKWYLSGEKIFITSGHGQYGLVLARSEDAPGLKGLSLFLVPRVIERDGKHVKNVTVSKLEEKLGHHGSATVSLVYDESEGELIGKRGQGFELMAALMNSARIGVGVEGIGNAEAAYRMARDYAALRRTMGKPIDQHELVAEKLFEMDLWIRGLRALAFDCMNAAEMAYRLEIRKLHDPPRDEAGMDQLKATYARYSRRARRLTPLLKYLSGERSVAICRDAMQLHGGMGYVDETGIHKRLRDALVLPVYEGTSQIQALMVAKDQLMWTTRDPAGFLGRLARARLGARTATTPMWREVHRAQAVALGGLETVVLRIFGQKVRSDWEEGLKGQNPAAFGRYLTRQFLRNWDVKADFAHGLLHAERLTRMLGDVAIVKALARQADRFPHRKPLAEAFLHRAMLRLESTAREIEHDDGRVFQAIAARQDVAETA